MSAAREIEAARERVNADPIRRRIAEIDDLIAFSEGKEPLGPVYGERLSLLEQLGPRVWRCQHQRESTKWGGARPYSTFDEALLCLDRHHRVYARFAHEMNRPGRRDVWVDAIQVDREAGTAEFRCDDGVWRVWKEHA